jgi:hypothetical protein
LAEDAVRSGVDLLEVIEKTVVLLSLLARYQEHYGRRH